MKSKKKLIYKLHQNIYQNPFKKVEEASFRNAGVKQYDFNKLKSIRAISLKGLGEHIQPYKDHNYPIKSHSYLHSIDESTKKHIKQHPLYFENKILTEHNQTGVRPSLNEYNHENSSKQKFQFVNRKPEKTNKEFVDDQIIKCRKKKQQNPITAQNRASQEQLSQKVQLTEKQSIRPRNPSRHHRNVSLPLINHQKQQLQFRKKSKTKNHEEPKNSSFTQEKNAKQQIIKELLIKNSQQKINNQVLLSLKMKSTQNLQKISRSQSEIIKVDKWKEKYGQPLQNKKGENQQIQVPGANDKIKKAKTLLPAIEGVQKQSQINPLKKNELLKSKTELFEDLKTKKPQFTQAASDFKDGFGPKTLLEQQMQLMSKSPAKNDLNFNFNEYQSMEVQSKKQESHKKKHVFCLNFYLARQSLSNARSKFQLPKDEIPYDEQPLKITVKQMKKHQRKNKQNLNLQKEINKNTKINVHESNQDQDKNVQNLNGVLNSTEPIRKPIPNQQNNIPSPEKQKNCEQGLVNEKDQMDPNTPTKRGNNRLQRKNSSPSKEPFFSNKQARGRKCKINEQTNLIKKMQESQGKWEWQQQKYEQLEEFEFSAFVKDRSKESLQN